MIVMEMITSNGVRVAFDDSAYRDCSEEEIAARIADARRTAWWCHARAYARSVQKNRPREACPEDDSPGAVSAAPAVRVTGKQYITKEEGLQC